MAEKSKTFRVTSFEQVVYEQIVEAKDEDQAVKKACEAGDWGNAESGEVISQEAEEISSEFTDNDGNPISEDEQARADGEADKLRKGEDD